MPHFGKFFVRTLVEQWAYVIKYGVEKKIPKWTNSTLKIGFYTFWRPYWIYDPHIAFEANFKIAQMQFSNSVI